VSYQLKGLSQEVWEGIDNVSPFRMTLLDSDDKRIFKGIVALVSIEISYDNSGVPQIELDFESDEIDVRIQVVNGECQIDRDSRQKCSYMFKTIYRLTKKEIWCDQVMLAATTIGRGIGTALLDGYVNSENPCSEII
jgi:hypothetical protein